MFCKHCGSKVEGHHLFCPTCGERLDAHGKKFPTLLKWISALLILGALVSGYLFYNTTEPQKAVQDQLVALKNNQLTEAYYSFTSKEFQKATPLEKFKEIIRSFQPLSQIREIQVDEKEEKNDRTRLNMTLKTEDNQSFKMEYDLVKEDGDWKIVFFKLLSNPVPEAEEKKADLSEPKESASDLINKQLDFFRNGQIEESYNELVSRDFKNATSLKTFKDFVSSNPILTDFVSFKQGIESSENGIKRIKVLLSGTQDDKHLLDYTIVEENNVWKINGMQLLPEGTSDSTTEDTPPQFNEETIYNYISGFIEAIKEGEPEKAYSDFTTEDFKKATDEATFSKIVNEYPSFVQNETLEIKSISFKNNVGIVIASIQGQNDKRMAQFDLMPEEGAWKIQQIQIYKAPEQDDMKMRVVEIGTEKDAKGQILNNGFVFKDPPKELFINVFLTNAKKGDSLSLMLVNEEHKVKSPVITHDVSADAADYVAFFSFKAPKTGWPPGDYKVFGETSTGDKFESHFSVE